MNGLVVAAVEQYVAARRGEDNKLVARLSIEILGVLPMSEFDLDVEMVRPGRTIELVEATASAAGRPCVRTRIWRLEPYDTAAVAGGQSEPLPPPENFPTWPLSSVWPGGYIESVDIRPIRPAEPGRATAWVSTPLDLIAGEVVSELARFVALIDTANGIAVRQPIDRWMFPNVEMSVHFYRQPVGPPCGLDTTVVFGPTGQGLTSSVLHDVDGPVGTAQQQLTVRPRA